MKDKDIYDEISSIKNIMERSSKFISLSGLSGILAGIYALIGVAVTCVIIKDNPTEVSNKPLVGSLFEIFDNILNVFMGVLITASAVLLASIITGCVLSYRKAKRRGQPVWNTTSRLLLYNMLIPLMTGGAVVFILIYRGNITFIVPAMLVFYGLSLFNAGNFTFSEIKYLGLTDIILGLVTAFFPGIWFMGLGPRFWGTAHFIRYHDVL